MGTLPSELRNQLERVVVEARDAAEAGARAALQALAVHEAKHYPHMSKQQRELRNHLRARARRLGDRQDRSGRLAIDHLICECAYEHWHRMLFARFLAENGLLIEPEMGVAISLAEAEELAKDEGVDVWVYASRCAQRMLPQIFRPDDPLLQISFATEHRVELERLLDSLPTGVFTASDALGWVYQFWQSKKKDEVNRSEVKIGADELPAVTQLFTEPYMVLFLLHNTLGAWWAGKNLTAEDTENAETEEELRKKLALPGVNWEYLRFVRGEDGKGGPWRPAAGTFEGWPKAAKDIKVLDPCCGSGHFLVAALHHLVPIRMAEEGLSARQAVDAVLRDNLHGLEIDHRCCQIAAFALAFAAWTYPDAGGYRELPELHIACSGIGPQCTAEEWLKLAEQSGIPMPAVGREAIRNGLLNLHRLFSQAPTLGSLINPAELPADLIAADYETIQPYLTAILKAEQADDETRERAIAAAGMVKAAELLAGECTLVITNVPYLGTRKQNPTLRAFCEAKHKAVRHDLANVCQERAMALCAKGGTTALVLPHNWLFASSFIGWRRYLIDHASWNLIGRLGEGGFASPQAAGALVVLSIISAEEAPAGHCLSGIEASDDAGPQAKAARLASGDVFVGSQASQAKNPDARILLSEHTDSALLEDYAVSLAGIQNGDSPRYQRSFWELAAISERWAFEQGSPAGTALYDGMDTVLDYDLNEGHLRAPEDWRREQLHDSDQRGKPVWGKRGVLVSRMRSLPCTMYEGHPYDQSCAALVPHDPRHLPAVWTFCSSPEYCEAVRAVDKKINVTSATLAKVPFDLARWRKVAAKQHPDGLPEPESDDPTQWLFHGRPEESTAPLQVAVARLLGYRWPAELDDKMRLSKRARKLVKRCDELAEFADADGIVCIPSVRGEEPAAERLRRLLAAAFGDAWSAERERELIAATGSKETTLDGWLRNEFFQQHCQLFHHRPFIWHIWDGRKRDGFGALVNYHKLAEGGGKGRKLLESLTYSYLGEWIARQKDEVKRGEGGAEDRLAAALELQKRLEAILEGEPPFDIFVRWKPLHQQPIGWEPDINDGVRLNIRPFLASDLPNGRKGAGVLRYKPNIKWGKDRGKEPQRPKAEYPWFWSFDPDNPDHAIDFMGGADFDGNRWNGLHYTNKTKQAAREARESTS